MGESIDPPENLVSLIRPNNNKKFGTTNVGGIIFIHLFFLAIAITPSIFVLISIPDALNPFLCYSDIVFLFLFTTDGLINSITSVVVSLILLVLERFHCVHRAAASSGTHIVKSASRIHSSPPLYNSVYHTTSAECIILLTRPFSDPPLLEKKKK
jgi:hypothetical protein